MNKKSSIRHKICLLFLAFLLFLSPVSFASNKTLILFPLAFYADQSKSYLHRGLKSMFVSRLSGEGLEVISDESLESLLNKEEKQGIISREKAEEIARSLKADYAIFGSMTAIGGGYSLDLSILDLTKDKPEVTMVSEAMDEDQFIPKLADVVYQFRTIITGIDIRAMKMAAYPGILPEGESTKGLFFKPTAEGSVFKPTGSIRIRMAVMAFDTGDLNGDGEPELVILGRKKLLLYNREGESLLLKDSLEASLGENFIKVSVGDADKNGSSEIYLVSSHGMRARTRVLKWTGSFKRLYSRMGHMQVIKGRVGTLLLYQNSEINKVFAGGIDVMDYGNGGKLSRRESLTGMEGAQFYTLTLFDLNRDGRSEFLGLGKRSHLHVWDRQGEVLWRDDNKIGGTNNAISQKAVAPGRIVPKIFFNSRIVITDIDGDGKEEVLAIKNIPIIDNLEQFKVFIKSNIIAYRIDGTSLSSAWKTRRLNYCITDMQADGETLYLAAQKGKISKMGKGSGRILWFE